MCQLILMIPSKQPLFLTVLLWVVFNAQLGLADAQSNSEVLKKICSGSCSGFGAGIKLLADKKGVVQYYRFDGSIRDCSHPPSVIYDLKGNIVSAMGSNPVDPKNPAQAKKITEWQRLQKDLTESKIIWCESVGSAHGPV